MRHDLDLALADLGDLDDVPEVADAVVDFDLVVEEFLEGGDVEDFVGGGLGGVDYELCVVDGWGFGLVEFALGWDGC